ncbi:uncharacterized protein LOC134277179 isoform X2 [Saccostrea cucullata]|uniref:uncharacterized protein LOC134277179 isoform X2 n=2 Tax=Saccostrea cuccullata TaxID=36930 RepID=UPI002ED308D1
MADAPSPSVLYFDPKKTTENFARLCQFLVTICSDVMRDILSHYIKPANLRTELDKNRSKLEKIMNKLEKDKLYPPHSSSSSVPPIRSRDLDLSLLYKILRNICNIPTHIAGWGEHPRAGDFSLAACIERIRILRNSISGHSTNGTVDDVEFEDYWRELRRSVVEIEKEITGSDRYERGIDHLYDCDLNPAKAKEYVAQIRKCSGELKVKRERIDLVEEEAKAKRVRLENLEERQSLLEKSNATFKANIEARLNEIVTGLTTVKSDILKELKSIELRLQQERGTSSIRYSGTDNCGEISTSTYTTSKSTKTIKFKPMLPNSHFSMHVTRDNKCWLLISSYSLVSSRLYLLGEVGFDKVIKIPKMYDAGLFYCNITVNENLEAVFVSRKSLVAAGANGVFRKLFDIPEIPTDYGRICFMRSGEYIVQCPAGLFFEYSKKGEFLRHWVLTAISHLHIRQSRFYQNSNEDVIIIEERPWERSRDVYFLNKDLKLISQITLENGGITPVFNKAGHLLHGHGQSIDLLDSKGQFIKTIYRTHRFDEISNMACYSSGTIWILYSSNEIDILKLEFIL